MISHNVSIRKMVHADYEIMARWLSTPEVLEFYGDVDSPYTLDQVKAKYKPRVNGEVHVYPFIVELDTMPIGLMQYYKLAQEIQAEFGYSPTLNVCGIDQFIGVPEYFNQGIGTNMVTKFINTLFHLKDVDLIVLDPEVFNTRAVRCYEKCGFKKVKKVHNETCWLMELEARNNIFITSKDFIS